MERDDPAEREEDRRGRRGLVPEESPGRVSGEKDREGAEQDLDELNRHERARRQREDRREEVRVERREEERLGPAREQDVPRRDPPRDVQVRVPVEPSARLEKRMVVEPGEDERLQRQRPEGDEEEAPARRHAPMVTALLVAPQSIFAITASPNSLHLISVAPSIWRAKSYVTLFARMAPFMPARTLSAASDHPM